MGGVTLTNTQTAFCVLISKISLVFFYRYLNTTESAPVWKKVIQTCFADHGTQTYEPTYCGLGRLALFVKVPTDWRWFPWNWNFIFLKNKWLEGRLTLLLYRFVVLIKTSRKLLFLSMCKFPSANRSILFSSQQFTCAICHLQIEKYDNLPKTICIDCVEKLNQQYNLIKKIRWSMSIHREHERYHVSQDCTFNYC